MHRIKIIEISRGVFSQRGFGRRGCYGSACGDACCRYGCDVDKESYELMWRHRGLIEKLVGAPLEDCFEEGWSGDPEFLGGNSIESAVGESGYCAFHLPGKKGCALYLLVREKSLSRRLIPSICRLYPLTWGYGKLFVTDDCEETCDCLAEENRTLRTIYRTQKREIEDIFDLEGAEYF